MAKRNLYPGGVKITLKKARELAMQEFGTAKGLRKEEPAPYGYYVMQIGNLHVRIFPDICHETGCIIVTATLGFGEGRSIQIHDPETLEINFEAQEVYRRAERREDFKDWVCSNGPEYCANKVNRVWERA